MNNFFRGRIFSAFMLFTFPSFSTETLQYYVVIGAFEKEANARKFAGYARNLYLDAHYKFNVKRNLYYVHIMASPRKDEARNWTLYIQNETKFKDAWVYTDLAGKESSLKEESVG